MAVDTAPRSQLSPTSAVMVVSETGTTERVTAIRKFDHYTKVTDGQSQGQQERGVEKPRG
jgi:hypothetical protein